MKKLFYGILTAALITGIFAGCSGKKAENSGVTEEVTNQVADASEMTEVEEVADDDMTPVKASELNEGTYEVTMRSSSSMFKVDHAELSVSKDALSVKLFMKSQAYSYMYEGTAKEAAEADVHIPLESEGDGGSFTLNIDALDAPVEAAAFSVRKQKWYDRTLLFESSSLPAEAFREKKMVEVKDLGLSDGEYTCEVKLSGGSGKAKLTSPCKIKIEGDKCTATIEWSSDKYDYMMVGDERYEPINSEGNSVFEIPVTGFDYAMPVQADTTAMSQPYLIDYTIFFDSSTIVGGEADLSYATGFSVDRRDGGDALITIGDDKYLLTDKEVTGEDVTVIKKPVDNIYLASSSAMDLFLQGNALSEVKMTSTREADWTIPEIREAMDRGDLLFVGKYNAPDYETLVEKGCDLVIENTMIYHDPKTKEQLERLGIPVIVETSSYEEHVLGRMEWIKLYGLLTGHENEAEDFFLDAKKRIENLEAREYESKKVAFFYITSSGYINVRKKGDYITELIEMAGGEYALSKLKEDGEKNALSTMNIDVETFVDQAGDADVLIYNSTVAGSPESLEELIKEGDFLRDFKAVKNHQVWYTGANMFQMTGSLPLVAEELAKVISGDDDEGLSFFSKLK